MSNTVHCAFCILTFDSPHNECFLAVGACHHVLCRWCCASIVCTLDLASDSSKPQAPSVCMQYHYFQCMQRQNSWTDTPFIDLHSQHISDILNLPCSHSTTVITETVILSLKCTVNPSSLSLSGKLWAWSMNLWVGVKIFMNMLYRHGNVHLVPPGRVCIRKSMQVHTVYKRCHMSRYFVRRP